MIRIQMYIEKQMQKDLQDLATREGNNTSVAKIMRDILQEGIQRKKNTDYSGKNTFQKLLDMNITGGEDLNLSENIDQYLYNTPKNNHE